MSLKLNGISYSPFAFGRRFLISSDVKTSWKIKEKAKPGTKTLNSSLT
jgi:hypothetical protein